MLTKLATIPEVDEFGFTRVIPFGPRGQGLEKYAGLPDGVQKYIDHHHVKGSDGKVGVLLVAMGATEYWAENSNGDIWYEPSLLHVPPNWTDDPDTDQTLAKGWGWGYPTFYNAKSFAHHTNKDPGRSIGDVSYATWDPFMHWVLLVVSLDVQRCHKFGGDWMLERVAAKRSVPWSMGSRVPFDLSSTSPDEERYLQVWNSFDPSKYKTPAEAILAEHTRKPIYGLSRTRRDYPQELLYNMGTILSDGRKIGAINDFPNFFDISGVGVPADPTAWSIMKLGSTRCELSGVKCPGSCKHGACRKFTTPGVVLWDQLEEQMSKAASVHEASIGKGGDVRKAADIDKDTRPQIQASSPVDPEDPDLPKDLLNRMGQDLPLDQSLSTPSLMGMVLKPREFRRIVMVHMGKGDLADKLDDTKTNLPRVLDSESPCSMDSGSFNDILGPILSSFLDHRSCLGPVLGRVKIIIIKAEPKGGSEPTDEPELQRKVASLYNGYRKTMLEKIGNVKQVVATRPWLHNAIFGVDFLNKTGSLSGTLVPLVTQQTLRYLRG